MKNIFKYMAGMLVTGLVMTACSPEDFTGANGNIPQASDYADNFKITVDQTTNYANFEFTSAPGVSPIWIIDGSYMASYNLSKYYRKKGSYTVECKVKNANGISDGSVTKTFTVDKTIMNGFGGFVEDSDFNLFKGVTFNVASFWYAPGWNQIADPKYSYQNGAFVVTLPEATTDQWQAQMHVELDKAIALPADKTYDFSVIITSTTKHPGVTVKLQQKGDDNMLINMQRVALDANEPKCVWFSNVAGVDITDLKFALDFGGNAANTDITLESFVLKDHANDDGTVVPEVQEPEPSWVKVGSDDNLWNGATFTNSFYYAPGWAQIANPDLVADGNAYTLTFPEATGEQWQNQVIFSTDLSADVETAYDFCVILNPSVDLKGVTVKLVQSDEPDVKHDDNFFFAEQTDLLGNEDNKFWVASKKAPKDMHAISLVFDFGGNPADTKVTVKDIIFQTHRD
ncbi:hypothetical protein [Bacteroides sp.]|uniref:hypothetical protein n=1 Tax=Bacteroides sp. TaxID=29523 RepID=UPI002618A00D|nr:hypothetical protein [Bacteroides sp.]